MSAEPLILASGSPRRRELLGRVGIAIDVIPPDVDETPHDDEPAIEYVRRLALAKARAVASSCEGRAVLAADTIVVNDGVILGKPVDAADAESMLRRLCGVSHEVTTAFAIVAGERELLEAVTTVVTMRSATEAEVAGYIASGEWRGKAGGYAIQGIAAALVTGVSGSVTNVIGLPLAEVLAALERCGVDADFAAGTPA